MPSFSTYLVLCSSSCSSSSSSSSSASSPYFALYKDFTSVSISSSSDTVLGRPRVTVQVMPSFSTYLVSSSSACSSFSSSSSSKSSPYFVLYKAFTSASESSSCDVVGGRPRVTTQVMPSFSTYLVLCSSACSSSSSSSSSTSSPYFILYKDFTSASLSSSCDIVGGHPRVTVHVTPSISTYL